MNLKKIPLLLVLLAFVFGVAACQQDGPAENAGEKIDNATEELGDNIEDATQ